MLSNQRSLGNGKYASTVFTVDSASINGGVLVTDGTLYPGPFNVIVFREDTVFAAIDSNWEGTALTDTTWRDRETIFGQFENLQLSSGSCIAYKE